MKIENTEMPDKKPHILLFNPDQMRADIMGHLGSGSTVTPFIDSLVENEAVSYANTCCQAPVCTPSRCSFATGLYPHVNGHRSLHHMLHAERGEKNMFQVLRENGYFVWWGGKNDIVTADAGPEAFCDIHFRPDDAFFERHHSRPRDDNHSAGESWRGKPCSDTFYSFFRGELKKGNQDRYYLDSDWQNVLGAIEFIENAPTDRPLCIYLPILYPHPPYGVETEFFEASANAPLPPRRHASEEQLSRKPDMLRQIRKAQRLEGWTEERWDALRRTYLGMVARVDRQFELLMAALKRAGIYDDTAVFMFSDHGDYTGDYEVVEKSQTTMEDPIVRVPLVVKPPKQIPVTPGVRDHVMAELIDMTATVFDLANADPGYDHFGRTLTPSLADPAIPHRQYAFCEGGRRPDEMQVSEQESLLQFGSDPTEGLYFPRINIQVNDARAHARTVMIRSLTHKYIRRMSGEDEFYDLRADPMELANRIDDPALATELARHKDALLGWYLETSDIVPRKTDSRWKTKIDERSPAAKATGLES
ncbi:sulfatase-like hydrolase/transferase [Martelella limonii]|uniref:sulfatase-like hydrolase/transferase n=1 Tax=Martelella limonii TaxID=1647649 RepID=UPI0015811919|nr:sulfatase-like hydrolase/transferase [Martelella limonii]